MVQIPCNEGIAHESDSSMLEQSVYTIKIGVLRFRAHCFAHAAGWDYVEVLVARALLCVTLVVVGLMTRCATQVVSFTHGHVDMLMGNPRCHGRRGLLVCFACAWRISCI